MPDLIALVELGSNAARFMLARVIPGVGFRVLDEERVQTRLGSGVPGTLPREAIEDTLRAVHRFLGRVRSGQSPRVVAVATSAVRDATNRERLLGALRHDEGLEVWVLSSRQEARLGALAVRWSLPFEDGVIVDLGGGSLQLTRLRKGRVTSIASVPLGVVRLTRRFLRHDPPTLRGLRALRGEIRAELSRALPRGRRREELVGLGGTVRALARLHIEAHPDSGKSRHGLCLRQSDVTTIRAELEPLTVRQRQRLPGVKADRADIILAGAIVIEEVMIFGGYLALIVCTRGVRDGLLLREAFNGEG